MESGRIIKYLRTSMKLDRPLAILCFCLFLPNLLSAQKRYYKGNTHTHCFPKSSDVKDSSYTAEKVVAGYRAKGYDFIVFTDHLNQWEASGLSTQDFTVINGSEAGLSGGYKGHFTAVNIKNNITGKGKSFQQLIDNITAEGGIAFLNHPRWSVIPVSALQIINEMPRDLHHLEVYNAVTDSPTTFDTSVWDSVLTTGREIFGIASDDSHRETGQGKAWISVFASSLHPDTLLGAIRNGDFYASNGIVLEKVDYRKDSLYVRSSNGTKIRFLGRQGIVLSTIEGGEGNYVTRGDEGYVRAEISNEMRQTAWTQPLMVSSSIPSQP